MSDKKSELIKKIEECWNGYLDAVIYADLNAFSTYLSQDSYIAHMGQGRIEPSRDVRLEGVRAAFDQSRSAGSLGDADALQDRKTEIAVLSDDLVLVQFSCFLRDANLRYGISSIFRRMDGGWKTIHSHDSTAIEE